MCSRLIGATSHAKQPLEHGHIMSRDSPSSDEMRVRGHLSSSNNEPAAAQMDSAVAQEQKS